MVNTYTDIHSVFLPSGLLGTLGELHLPAGVKNNNKYDPEILILSNLEAQIILDHERIEHIELKCSIDTPNLHTHVLMGICIDIGESIPFRRPTSPMWP